MTIRRFILDMHGRAHVGDWRHAPLYLLAAAIFAIGSLGFSYEAACAQAPALAQSVQQNGAIISLPQKRKISRTSGLALQVDTRWANNFGYRPVEFVFTLSQPTTADHAIKIRLHGSWWNTRGGTMSVEEDFELPAGSTSLTAQVSFPQYRSTGQFFWWDVWIDGKKDTDLSLEGITAMSTPGGMIQQAVNGTAMLVVGPKSRRRQLTAPPTVDFSILSLPAAEFPTIWSDYSCFDLVALSLDELRDLARSHPKNLAALREWVRAGGQLWIGDAGNEWEQLPVVAEALGLTGPLPGESVATSEPEDELDDVDEAPQLGWQSRQFRRFGGNGGGAESMVFVNLVTNERHATQDPTEIAQLQQNPDYIVVGSNAMEGDGARMTRRSLEMDAPQGLRDEATAEADQSRSQRRRRRPRNSSAWFVDHELGFGTVRAYRGSWEPVAMTTVMTATDESGQAIPPMERMSPSMQMAFRSTRDWSERHGLAPDQANPDFANLLVPGLGLAPVTEFRVLITLFVILIGPFNYWMLKRLGRLHLLVLTVPLAAGLLTSALFAYAAISDGFGTAVRVRSFTTLDQRTGDASCWARLSYYSGLAPSGGLTFPSDAVVYPIPPGWRDARFDPDFGVAREIAWGEAEDRFSRGWLTSRTPTQYLTVRARKSPHRIDFAQANERMRATNKLGSAIRYLVVIDSSGNLFEGEAIAAGARTFLKPTNRSEAIRHIRQLIMSNQPEAPPALANGGGDFGFLGIRPQTRYMRNSGDYGSERLTDNLLEVKIGDLGGMNGLAPLQLGPKSYVAFTETGPEVSLGHAGIEEQASFHLLVGEW